MKEQTNSTAPGSLHKLNLKLKKKNQTINLYCSRTRNFARSLRNIQQFFFPPHCSFAYRENDSERARAQSTTPRVSGKNHQTIRKSKKKINKKPPSA
jgi:hypothetical protein